MSEIIIFNRKYFSKYHKRFYELCRLYYRKSMGRLADLCIYLWCRYSEVKVMWNTWTLSDKRCVPSLPRAFPLSHSLLCPRLLELSCPQSATLLTPWFKLNVVSFHVDLTICIICGTRRVKCTLSSVKICPPLVSCCVKVSLTCLYRLWCGKAAVCQSSVIV